MSSLIEPFTGQEIQRWQLKPGDHIYTWRKYFVYAHHGIYLGDEKVIQFSAASGQKVVVEAIADSFIHNKPCKKCGGLLNRTSNGVLITCLDCFLAGGKIYRYEYSVPWALFLTMRRGGTCTTAVSDTPEKVLERAKSRIEKGFGVYHFTQNNCEDFAFYCKTGNKNTKSSSGQTNEVLSRAAGVAAGATVFGGLLLLSTLLLRQGETRKKTMEEGETRKKTRINNTSLSY